MPRYLRIIGCALLVALLATAWAFLTRDATPGSATGVLAALFLGLPAALLLEHLAGEVIVFAEHWPRPLRMLYAAIAMLLLAGLLAGPVYVVRNWAAG